MYVDAGESGRGSATSPGRNSRGQLDTVFGELAPISESPIYGVLRTSNRSPTDPILICQSADGEKLGVCLAAASWAPLASLEGIADAQ